MEIESEEVEKLRRLYAEIIALRIAILDAMLRRLS